MNNDALKQATMLEKLLDINNQQIEDVIVTVKMKNDDIYKVMNDGSIVRLSAKGNKAFANANEVSMMIESKTKSSDSCKKYRIKVSK